MERRLNKIFKISILYFSDEKKAKITIDEIVAKTGNNNIRFIQCDLADLQSIATASREVKNSVSKVDILQLNSGVMAIPTRETTKVILDSCKENKNNYSDCMTVSLHLQDGFEKQLGINHLGHFFLTQELFPLLKKVII